MVTLSSLRHCGLLVSSRLNNTLFRPSVSLHQLTASQPVPSLLLIRHKFDLAPPKDNPRNTADVKYPPETFQNPADSSPDHLNRDSPVGSTRRERGGIPLAELVKPGQRGTVSGIVATVFGASGFIGNNVVYYLGSIGSQVIVPYRGDGMNIRHLKLSGDLGQIVPMPCDIALEDSVRATLSRSNVVVNCLGKAWETPNYTYHDVHVKITYRLCKLAKEMGVEKWIQISCVGADVNSESGLLRSKAEQEAVVCSFFPDAVILRCCPVYGNRDRFFLNWTATLGQSFYAIPVLRQGQQLIQPIEVHDVAKAVVASITQREAEGHIFELGGPDIYTFKSLTRLIGHSAFLKIRLMSLPEPALRLYGRMMQGMRLKKPANWQPWKINPRNPFRFLFRILNMFDWRDILNHIGAPALYHEDLVPQQKIDKIVSNSSHIKTLADLGLKPAEFVNRVYVYMLPFRPVNERPDRFPNADKLKQQAQTQAQY